MSENPRSPERVLEDAVSRALRENLAPLQSTIDDLEKAFADLIAACSSASPGNALPAMLRAQTSAAALTAGLSALSNFVSFALKPVSHGPLAASATAPAPAMQPSASAAAPAMDDASEPAWVEEPAAPVPEAAPQPAPVSVAPPVAPPVAAPVAAPPAAFELSALPTELQDLHRRASRVAKVAMQDIQLLRPAEVELGREHKDICQRLRRDLDKARKEYDRRFEAIQDHPVDYFHDWMVQILAGGDPAALGEYPYPSPVLR